jgi:hypothetical protein
MQFTLREEITFMSNNIDTMLEFRIPRIQIMVQFLTIPVIGLGVIAIPVTSNGGDFAPMIDLWAVDGVLIMLIAISTWLGTRGPRPRLSTEGVHLKCFAWDRTPTTIPWKQIHRLWIERTGIKLYLYVLPNEPERYIAARNVLARIIMRYLLRNRGAPMRIQLPPNRPTTAHIDRVVRTCSGETRSLG